MEITRHARKLSVPCVTLNWHHTMLYSLKVISISSTSNRTYLQGKIIVNENLVGRVESVVILQQVHQ